MWVSWRPVGLWADCVFLPRWLLGQRKVELGALYARPAVAWKARVTWCQVLRGGLSVSPWLSSARRDVRWRAPVFLKLQWAEGRLGVKTFHSFRSSWSLLFFPAFWLQVSPPQRPASQGLEARESHEGAAEHFNYRPGGNWDVCPLGSPNWPAEPWNSSAGIPKQGASVAINTDWLSI